MDKRKFLAVCMQQDIAWLKGCASSPSPYMRPLHVALVRIAIRRKIS